MHSADTTTRDRLTALRDLVVDCPGVELGSVRPWLLSALGRGEPLSDLPLCRWELSSYLWFHLKTSARLVVTRLQPSNTPASRFDPENVRAAAFYVISDADSSSSGLARSPERRSPPRHAYVQGYSTKCQAPLIASFGTSHRRLGKESPTDIVTICGGGRRGEVHVG